ncbi:hypothetical protein BC940DRAFT_363077 [Gongronella butleri]|nr:hypothetical protein BC940DRAFT_363077 [Gongronella butleri]
MATRGETVSLNHMQRQRLTSNLFVVVAAGAVVTVALPTLFPCPAFDQNDKAARLEARRKYKEKQVIVHARAKASDEDEKVTATSSS